MERLRPIAVVVGAAALAVAALPSSAVSGGKAPSDCGRVEFISQLEVVFGRFKTQAAAVAFRARVVHNGFTNADIIPGCSGFRVVVRGIETYDQAVELQAEARRVQYRTTVECVKAKDDVSELEVVFGHRRDRVTATELVQRAAQEGFTGLLLESDPCGGFEVMIKGFSDRTQANDFVDEAQTGGFTVVIERS